MNESMTTGQVVVTLENDHSLRFEAPKTTRLVRMVAIVCTNSFGSSVIELSGEIAPGKWETLPRIPMRNDWSRSR